MQLSLFFPSTTPHYTPLTSSDDLSKNIETSLPPRDHQATPFINFFLGISALTITLFIGFLLGRLPSSSQIASLDSLLPPAGNQLETWIYNRTFSSAPTNETELAWREIFPKGRGFIHHPTLAPNISGIAVFHELHCLNGIRLAYYSALSQFSSSPDPNHHQTQHTQHDTDDPAHIRHCFDYLRHALTCAADTNLEQINWEYRGVTGWGFERKCRNYHAVVEFAELWRTHEQTAIS